MKIQAIECTRCKGELKEKGKYWECLYCGAKFSVQLDADGDQIIYRNDAPKELPCGQVAEKAAQIFVDKITTVDIKPPQTIESDVYQSSDDLDYYDNVNLIVTYLKKEKWDIAQDNICKLRDLKDPCSIAVADWYEMAWEHKSHNDAELVSSFASVRDDELQKLYNLLLNAMPDFRKCILDLVISSGYVGDEPTTKILATTLPFLFSELIYSTEERNEKIEIVFDEVISLGYAQTFKYLLTHALESHEVDRYISYLERFADNCTPETSQEYYSMIIAHDANNAAAHHRLVEADIKANSSDKKCIADFENLLKYSQSPTEDVKKFILILLNEKTTTEMKSEFMWGILSYYHENVDEQTQAMSQYADLLLQSELWDKASEFYSAVLSRDTRNAKVYFNLCLADMQAKNTKQLISKEDDFSGHPYYKKALAQAYKTNPDYAKELEDLIDSRDKRLKYEQEEKEKKKKIILVGAIFILIIGLLVWFRYFIENQKYVEEVPEISYTYTPSAQDVSQDTSEETSTEMVDPEVIASQAEALALTGDYSEACELFEKYGYDDTYLYQAYKYASEGNFSDAVKNGLPVVVFPEGTETIPDSYFKNEFGGNELKKVVLPSSLKSIGISAFYGCSNLVEINLPSGLEVIGNYAFYNCQSLESIEIPDSVESIGSNVFEACSSLQNVIIPGSLKTVSSSAFRDCSNLTSVTLKNGVEVLDIGAFTGCTSLVNITLPDSLLTIESNVFYSCTSLIEITIPSKVDIIRYSAFSNCTSLQRVHFTNQEGWQDEYGGSNINVTNAQDNAKELKSVSSITWERK